MLLILFFLLQDLSPSPHSRLCPGQVELMRIGDLESRLGHEK